MCEKPRFRTRDVMAPRMQSTHHDDSQDPSCEECLADCFAGICGETFVQCANKGNCVTVCAPGYEAAVLHAENMRRPEWEG